MNRKQTRLKKQLQHILKTEPHSLRATVAREALEYGSDIATFFSDLLAHGCQSGMIGSLIYHTILINLMIRIMMKSKCCAWN